MKKRLIAAVLAIVMLLFALPMYVSAVDLSSLDDQIKLSYIRGDKIVYILYDMTVDEETTIPSDVMVILYSGTLKLEKPLIVKGQLYQFGGTIENKSNLDVDGYGIYIDYINTPYSFFFPGFPTTYPYPQPWLYPEEWNENWGWPIFMPNIPGGETGEISDYYYYLLYLYNQGLIDKDDLMSQYPYWWYYFDEDDWKDTYPYWYFNNYYPISYTCETPTANIKSGTTVDFGTSLTLSTATKDATIYYTTDGTTPDTTANVYTGPIKLNKTEMTIKAIAVKSGYKDSAVATFTYKTKSNISFTDLGTHAETLTPSLVTLVQAKIISDGTTLNPEGSVSYDELISWLKAVGINTAQAVIDETLITDKNALTYEDFAYICYRVLLNASRSVVLPPKKSSDVVLGQLKYGDSVTAKPSIVRAAVMSLVEANLFYKLDFHPKATATRAYAFYMLAEVYNKVN